MNARRRIERRIEALLSAGSVTIHEPTKAEIAVRLNSLNLNYEQTYRRSYIPHQSKEKFLYANTICWEGT